MKWVTREHPKTDRVDRPWLIRKFIDPGQTGEVASDARLLLVY